MFKTKLTLRTNLRRGSALVGVIIFGAIISICAAFAYRSTIFQTRMASRSEDYLASLNIAEAGAELAMLELNKSSTTAFTAWTGTDTKSLTTSISDYKGTAVGEVVVTVSQLDSEPRVVATGYVPNVATARLARTVQLGTKNNTVAPPWGEFGLFAFGNLSFSGNETIDSYLPSSPTAGTQKAAVASVGNMTFDGTQVIWGNIQAGGNITFDNNSEAVHGNVYYGGTLKKGPSKWNEATITGESKQSSLRTPARATPPTKPVKSAGDNNSQIKVKIGQTTTNGIGSGAALTSKNATITLPAPGTYYFSNVKPSGTSTINITGSGDVNIFVTSDFDLSSMAATTIASGGASGSPKVTVVANTFKPSNYQAINVNETSQFNVFADTISAGTGMKMLLSDTAKAMFSGRVLDMDGAAQLNVTAGQHGSYTPGSSSNFTLYASEKATFGAGAKVAGVFYGPDAETVYSGGFDWWGAVIGKNITIKGGPGVHIDETLFTPSGGSGAYVTAWTEVAPKK